MKQANMPNDEIPRDPRAAQLTPEPDVYEKALAVPGVVAGAGLASAQLSDMFGLWRLSRQKRAARRAEADLSAW